jgi:hypothetical protein
LKKEAERQAQTTKKRDASLSDEPGEVPYAVRYTTTIVSGAQQRVAYMVIAELQIDAIINIIIVPGRSVHRP